MLLATDTAYESSFSAFDLHGQFKTVTFTVACQYIDDIGWGYPTETLKLGSNEGIFEEIEISAELQPTTYTVDIDNTDRLMFWLQCGDGSSERFAIYDIKVAK